MKGAGLVAFLGPTLPAAEARAIAPSTVLGPARQGDVWRALALRPRAIALVDGLFESEPSVWHREILDALSAGVAVFGGGSMGALRAAELSRFGMVGVGEIFRAYRDGRLADDGEVALLHAGPEHAFRPFTVPLVNVRHAASVARSRGAVTRGEARAIVEAAERIFYMDRTWEAVLEAALPSLGDRALSRWKAFAAGGLPDLKAEDARATLAAARDFLRKSPRTPFRAPLREASSLVRRRKLLSEPRLRTLLALSAPRKGALAEAGLRRSLLAGLARSLGLAPSGRELSRAAAEWLRGGGARPGGKDRRLRELGLDYVDALRLVEDVALERILLENAPRIVPDGPSPLEGLAAEARRLGVRSSRRRRGRAATRGRLG